MKRLFLLVFAWPILVSAQSAIEEGARLVRTGGCVDCHTQNVARPMAGGVPIKVPGVGLFFPPNLTADPETGLGRWTFAQFKTALRDGRAPDGHAYWPVFPYRSYTKITDEDLEKIWAYLRAIPPVHNRVRHHRVSWKYSIPGGPAVWQEIFFGTSQTDPIARIRAGHGAFQSDPAHTPTWNRGAYLAEALLHCAECHSERDAFGFGAPNVDKWMGGSNIPVGGLYPPNITPGRLAWSAEQWNHFLVTGLRPDGQIVRAEMALVIQNTSNLTPADRAALVEYMRSLPRVE